MPKYRVIAGTHRKANGDRVERGETVELTEAQRSDFPAEKFELIETDGETATDTASESEPDDELDATVEETLDESVTDPPDQPNVEKVIPYDDYRQLSSMAAAYDGEEIHGAMAGADITDFLEGMSLSEVQQLKREAVKG